MHSADSYFQGFKLDKNKLEAFGFAFKAGKYSFTNDIAPGLEIRILVDSNNSVSFEVWDKDFNEECSNYLTSLSVKSLWLSVIDSIKENCCHAELYGSKQANEIDAFIKNTYKVEPEFLFSDYPHFGVYRNQRNKKWFGMIMNVDYSVFDKNKEGAVWIINLKADNVLELIKKGGFYPAYHMNKKMWVSVLLDETLSNKEIEKVIESSFRLVDHK